uniref:Uncharacterized protein n=1 Tax=Proboscia inermis TaxID=420281 RepID=A0A7S0C4T7_9STRA|mmetsp:Transcript_24172/g.24624  ORF Transcript_24172/g.24624 Transcript_24172/m.24624 type:complete len:125 (+) Transcript_24172:119-493(+)
MQRTNSRISFAQQMDKVHHFDVPFVASILTSNAYGKYHSGSDSESDEIDTSESYGDSTDTESDEENSAYQRTPKAKNAAKSSFITQNEVGDVLKDFFWWVTILEVVAFLVRGIRVNIISPREPR